MEIALVIFFAAVFSLLNSLHVIGQWIFNPPDRVFTGIAHFFADYFLYVSQFSEGAHGAWILARHVFTNEPMQPTWIYWFNVALGHLGNFVGLSPFATYNIALIMLVFFLILLWYYLCSLVYPANRFARLMCFTFIITASSFFDGKTFLGQFWFSPGLAFNRLGGVPHQVFQTILILLLTVSKNNLLVALLSFFTGVANPIQMLIFIVAKVLAVQKKILQVLVIIIFGGLGAYLTNVEFSKQAVFMAAKTWELNQSVPTGLLNLLLNIGPIILLVPFGLKVYFKKLSSLRLLFFIYGISAIALFLSPVPKFLGVSPSRFLSPILYAPLAILATEATMAIPSKFVAVMLFLLVTIPSLYQQVVNRITPSRNPLLLMDTIYNHVPKLTVEGLQILEKMPEDKSYPVVLTDPHYPIEILVPVFSGKISFSGHPIHTLYPDIKETLRQEFFNGEMNEQTAKSFLVNHRIGYIVASPNTSLSFPFLSKVYQNKEMAIFRFQSP